MALVPLAANLCGRAAFRLGGLTTFAGRLPFAFWAWRVFFWSTSWCAVILVTAPGPYGRGLLTCSVPFLLYARQCRYYSLGALLTLISLYAFRDKWQSKTLPALVLCLSLGLLFYANYLLFSSFAGAALLAAGLLDRCRVPLACSLTLSLAVGDSSFSRGYFSLPSTNRRRW